MAQKFFVMMSMSSGMNVIGVVEEEDLDNWKAGSYMTVENPKMLLQIPASEQSVQIVPAPIFPIKVAQDEVLLYPEVLNVIGEIEEDERTNVATCKGEDKLFPAYLEAVKSWRSELSGIEIVGANGMPKGGFPTGDSPPGVIPFPKK